MKLVAILLPLSIVFGGPSVAAAPHHASPRVVTPVDHHGFDWMLGGLGLAIVIGAIGTRPRRMMKVSA